MIGRILFSITLWLSRVVFSCFVAFGILIGAAAFYNGASADAYKVAGLFLVLGGFGFFALNIITKSNTPAQVEASFSGVIIFEASGPKTEPEQKCSFCNKSERESKKFIVTETVNICDDCAEAVSKLDREPNLLPPESNT